MLKALLLAVLAVLLVVLIGVSAAAPSVRLGASNLSSGNDQAYHEAGIRQLRGLNLTVCSVQEFNYGDNSQQALRGFVDQAFGTHFAFYRSHNSSYQLPNGVVYDPTRFRLLDNGTWNSPVIFNRGFAYARLQPLLSDSSVGAMLIWSNSKRPTETHKESVGTLMHTRTHAHIFTLTQSDRHTHTHPHSLTHSLTHKSPLSVLFSRCTLFVFVCFWSRSALSLS
jgi:hypothetical protein